MSFIPATSNRDLWVVLGAMVAGGFAFQWQNQRMEANPGEIVAACADGTVIGEWQDRVRRRPGRTQEQRARIESRFAGMKRSLRKMFLNEDLRPGALCFARVRSGREDEAAWVVDGLDADRDMTLITWEFDSEDAARRALDLLERRIVRPALDDDGTPARVTEAELDAVRAREDFELQKLELEGMAGTEV